MMMTVGCQKEDIAPIIPDTPIIPDGVLPGLFSVSATRQVRFSQGNLQYQASTNTWRFAEHQYDYVGSDNRSISSTYSGWIDLFGWGTGSNPTLSSSYPEDYGTFVDWGSNAIINGGNTTNLWRTLTSAEWEYLLNTRSGASSKLGSGNINGVGGLIILPDSWTLPSECSFASGFAIINPYHYPDWKHNSYTLAQWAQMEAAGAIFLPAAGRRKGTDFDNVGYSKNDAYHMYFSSYNLIASINCSRSYGYPIRPVLDN